MNTRIHLFHLSNLYVTFYTEKQKKLCKLHEMRTFPTTSIDLCYCVTFCCLVQHHITYCQRCNTKYSSFIEIMCCDIQPCRQWDDKNIYLTAKRCYLSTRILQMQYIVIHAFVT